MIKVIPMLSTVDPGDGETCVVVDAAQLQHCGTMTLMLPDYGQIMIVGTHKAILKIEEILAHLDMEYVLEDSEDSED